MVEVLLFDPLPQEPKDLSQALLNERQKRWVAQEIISGRTTAKDLSQKYNLKRNSVNQIVSRVKRGCCVRQGRGRPGLLDELSMERAESSILDKSMLVDHLEREFISGVVSTEYQETFQRRWPEKFREVLAANDELKMSKSSKNRYIAKLKQWSILDMVDGD